MTAVEPEAGKRVGAFESQMGRRGVLAGVAAIAGGLLAKLTADKASANHDGTSAQDLHLATTNSFNGTTTLLGNGGGVDGALKVVNSSGRGILAIGSSGESGIRGHSPNAYGVIGTTDSGNGVTAVSSLNGVGLRSESSGASGKAIYAINSSGGVGGAGTFVGNVEIQGNLSVTGTKSAVVPQADGTARRVYCLESPESFFEDFGFGKLANGQARVQLDPEFVALVHSNEYHVFLTEYDGHSGLFVNNRTAKGFEVRAKDDARSAATFSYRVTARRQDLNELRLERVQLTPKPAPLPDELKTSPKN